MKPTRKNILAVCCIAAISSTSMHFSDATAVNAADSVCINEVCAKNSTFAAADGAFYDWVELYNGGSSSVNLSGYGLSDDAERPYRFTIPEGIVLNSGQRLVIFCNSTAVELENQLCAPFGLSTSGETLLLTAPDGSEADSVTFGIMESDVSYGRVPDGGSDFAFMTMSPNAQNAASSVTAPDLQEPVLSNPTGFYDQGFSLSVTTPEGLTVRYTTDGSDPTSDSPIYSGPLQISDISGQANVLSARTDIAPSTWNSTVKAPYSPVDKAMIVKAAAFDAEGNRSDVVTGAYFIGYGGKDAYYKNLKIVSLTTDSANLFDHDKGIYVLGKTYEDWRNSSDYSPAAREWEIPGNYTESGSAWERPANMQIIENGSAAVDVNVGLRIHGGATRSMTQKSFNIYLRSDYGTTQLEYDLFSGDVKNRYDGDTVTDFDSFMIRNGGNDGWYTRFRDKLNQALVEDRSFLTQGMEPCIVFINGEFWGHYEITEKLSEDMIKSHYDVAKKDVCIIKNESLDEGDEAGYEDFKALDTWLEETDFSNDANYTALCDRVDMQSFLDYISADIYYNNTDWGGNNMALWRAMKTDTSNPYADGKWRFILFDTEYSVNLYGTQKPDSDTFAYLRDSKCFLGTLYRAALQHPQFRKELALTFMDMANENFNNERVQQMISQLSAQYHDFTIDTFNRFGPDWPGGSRAESHYQTQVSDVSSFYQQRFSNASGHLRNALSLQGQMVQLTICNDDALGTVKLNTITPTMKNGQWKGQYYTDYPVTLSAVRKDGYRFSHWTLSNGETLTDPTISLQLSNGVTVTANYEQVGDVNLDGNVNMADVVCFAKHINCQTLLTVQQADMADMNGSGTVDIVDYTLLKRYLLY